MCSSSAIIKSARSLFYLFFFPRQKLLNLGEDATLIHGVVPTKVTGHARGEKTKDIGILEFWNVGKLGGEQYLKAKFKWVPTLPDLNGGSTTLIWEGYFTGGLNGDIYVEDKGSKIHAKPNSGKAIIYGNDDSFPIDNPEVFNGWVY